MYARIWTEAGNVWRYADSSFTVAPIARLVTPVNGAPSVDVALPIQWTSVSGVQAYELWVGTAAGAHDLLDSNQTPQTTWIAASLPPGQTAYARIWTEVGNVWRFADSTFTVAPIARFVFPVNNAAAADVVNTPIQWTSAAGAQAYELWVGTSPGTNNLLDSNQTPLTTWTAASLPAGQTVYARIWTEAGNVWRFADLTFTVAPLARFVFPLNNAVAADVVNTAMQWTSVPGAQAYELWVGTSAGAHDVLDSNQTQQTAFAAPALPIGPTLFARIWTEAGNTWRFTDISFTAAPIARFVYPLNNAAGVDVVTKTFQWTTVPGAQAYELWVGTSSGAHDVLDSNQTPQTAFAAPGLPIGPTLFARIWTEAGSVWRFTEISFTVAPIATFTNPVNGAANVDLTQPITWTSVAGAQAYELWIGTTVGAHDVKDSGQTLQTSFGGATLPAGQLLYARLWTEAGTVWRSVDITFTGTPLTATLVQPAAGASSVSATQTFAWTAITGAQAYYLYVGTTMGGKDVVDSREIQPTSYAASALPTGRLLYARIWTKQGGVWRYSDMYVFDDGVLHVRGGAVGGDGGRGGRDGQLRGVSANGLCGHARQRGGVGVRVGERRDGDVSGGGESGHDGAVGDDHGGHCVVPSDTGGGPAAAGSGARAGGARRGHGAVLPHGRDRVGAARHGPGGASCLLARLFSVRPGVASIIFGSAAVWREGTRSGDAVRLLRRSLFFGRHGALHDGRSRAGA